MVAEAPKKEAAPAMPGGGGMGGRAAWTSKRPTRVNDIKAPEQSGAFCLRTTQWDQAAIGSATGPTESGMNAPLDARCLPEHHLKW